MAFSSLAEIDAYMKTNKCEFWEAVIREEARDSQQPEMDIVNRMTQMYRSMKEADEAYDDSLTSRSGLSGKNGKKMADYAATHKCMCGKFGGAVMARAIKMAESNACMKRIVAAPTAGSCGVVPAILITYERMTNTSENDMVKALFVAAGIGDVIARRASISGARGGCQAEIGTAAAMAAGALTFLQGGTTRQIMQAAAFALKNMLGLTCDPVGGLVEVPCIKRNVAGVVNAISAAQLAMAGIVSAISPDDTIDSMRRIGNELPVCLKETGMGGLAVTESAKKIMKKMLNVTEMLKID